MKKSDVKNALLAMGTSPALSGLEYITAAVIKLDTPEWKNGKIIALYAEIAKEYNSTLPRIERAIRHAFETVRAIGNNQYVKKYIGYENTANSDSLKMLLLILKRANNKSKQNEFSSLQSEENVANINSMNKLLETINAAITDYFLSR